MLSGSLHTPQLVLTYTPTSLKRCPLCSTPSLATCSSINLSDCAVDPVEVKFLAHSTHPLLLLNRVMFLYGKMCCNACIIVEILRVALIFEFHLLWAWYLCIHQQISKRHCYQIALRLPQPSASQNVIESATTHQ